MRVCGYGGLRRDVRDDLLWRLTMISLLNPLRVEHPPLISAEIVIALACWACWVGAGSLRTARACHAQHGQRDGGLDAY